VRTAIKLAIVLVAAGAMAWCFLFIYWHLRIGRAVRELQQGSPRAREVLHDAGCRALPYLVGAAKPSERLTFLAPATSLILIYLYGEVGLEGPVPKTPEIELLESLQIEPLDTVEVRTAKCRALQAWWRAEGDKHHQGWRIWSGRCR
jgi:hypothetical protein